MGTSKKSKNWYITLAVVGVGGSLASFIVGNILFGLLLLIGIFAIALAGSRPELSHAYGLSEKGVHIDKQIIPWDKIQEFSLKEGEPYLLNIDTNTSVGNTTIPLYDIDFRAVRTEFKNHDVDESDHVETIIENITRLIGL